MRVRGGWALLGLAVWVVAILPAGSTGGGGVEVEVGNFYFSPSEAEITAGDVVTWNWAGGTHNVEPTDGGDAWCPFQSSGSCSKTFASAGVFTYRCGAHPSMQGSVVVNGVAPLLAIVAPAEGADVEGEVVASGTVSHPVGITSMAWRLSGGAFQPVDSFGGGTWSTVVDTTLVPSGLALLEVVATGADGGVALASASVQVVNPPRVDLVLLSLEGETGTTDALLRIEGMNDGNVDIVDAPLRVAYQYHGTWRTIADLGVDLVAGGSGQWSVSWAAEGKIGSFPIRAVFDPDNVVTETSEGNNADTSSAAFVTDVVRGFDPFEPV